VSRVVFEDVSRIHADGTRALSHLFLEVADRELLAILGPSGSGKSTALRVLAGLEPIADGVIAVDGVIVNDLPPGRRDIAMVFESETLFPYLNTFKNLAFPLEMRKAPEDEVEHRVEAEARSLWLWGIRRRMPATLSAGQRRRTSIGRALVRVPRVFVLDEPFTHVDAAHRRRLRTEVGQIVKGLGVTTIFATHDQDDAMAMGDRVAVLLAGELQQVAQPRVLYARPANAFVASFIGTPPASLVMATLRIGTNSAWLEFGDQRLGLPSPWGPLRRYADRDVVLGIRPEQLRIATGSERDLIRTSVSRVDRLGSHDIAWCALDVPAPSPPGVEPGLPDARAELAVRLTRDHPVRRGDRLDLTLEPRRVHVFDPYTGMVVQHGEPE
jgi:ABC-type sugar transport system ATPase subunit